MNPARIGPAMSLLRLSGSFGAKYCHSHRKLEGQQLLVAVREEKCQDQNNRKTEGMFILTHPEAKSRETRGIQPTSKRGLLKNSGLVGHEELRFNFSFNTSGDAVASSGNVDFRRVYNDRLTAANDGQLNTVVRRRTERRAAKATGINRNVRGWGRLDASFNVDGSGVFRFDMHDKLFGRIAGTTGKHPKNGRKMKR